jgi:RNA recognition motif-containing protein
VAKLFAAARATPLFTEPIPAPVAEVKHAYFATSSTIVPDTHTVPSPFVPQAPAGIKTIIARNLPRAITPEELRERFHLYGVVRDVYLPRNKDPNSVHHGTIRGFALIKYDTAAESDRAVRVLSALGLSIRGKQVTVEFAKSDTAVRT